MPFLVDEEMISQTGQQITTAEQLFALPSDGNRHELVNGVLKMMSPVGSEHGDIAARIAYLLSKHVYELDLGMVYAAETGFLISNSPDTVRAPDSAFVSHESLGKVKRTKSYLPIAPDLVVELISPNDRLVIISPITDIFSDLARYRCFGIRPLAL